MRRRSKSVGRSAKTRLRQTAKQKGPHGSITQRGRISRSLGRETEIEPLTHELNAITEQQRATTEVLKLISSSFGDPQPVFASILASAVRLCDADNGVIRRWDGDALHLVATHNIPQAFIERRKQSPYKPHQHSPSGRMLATRNLIHIVDLAVDQAYLERNPPTVAAVELAGIRTVLVVPLWKDSALMPASRYCSTTSHPGVQQSAGAPKAGFPRFACRSIRGRKSQPFSPWQAPIPPLAIPQCAHRAIHQTRPRALAC